jgi:hypothetical protein
MKTKADSGRGHLVYYDLDRRALQNFFNMFSRVKRGLASRVQWPQSRTGYIAFLSEIGPKPDNGQKWTVGRKNHRWGYIAGNIEWQTLQDNLRQTPFSVKQREWARAFAIKRNKSKKWTKQEREEHSARMKRWHRDYDQQLHHQRRLL